jgi:hypothetical protein
VIVSSSTTPRSVLSPATSNSLGVARIKASCPPHGSKKVPIQKIHNFTKAPQRFHQPLHKYLITLQTAQKQTMAPKRNAREPTPSSTATTQSSSTAASSVPSLPSKASHKSSSNQSPQQIALGIWQNYLDTTPQRTKLIDVFMAFLVVVGGLQFAYCVIAGNYVCIQN